jgi:hypothetical protein
VREWDGQHLGAIRFGDQPRQISDLVLKRPAIAPSACLIRADIALKHPFDTNQRLQGTEDLELWMRLWAQGLRPIRWTDEPFTRYRINHGMSAELESHSIKIRLRWAQFVQQGWIPESVLKHAEGELTRQKARSHHKAGRFAEAQKAYWAAGFTFKNMILTVFTVLRIRI